MRFLKLLLTFMLCILPSAWGIGLTWLFMHQEGWMRDGGQIVWFVTIVVLGFLQVVLIDNFHKSTFQITGTSRDASFLNPDAKTSLRPVFF